MGVDRVIVVGASAGGVESLQALVSSLPAGLDAAIFVVLHLSPNHVSHLPQILGRQHVSRQAPGRQGKNPGRHHLCRASGPSSADRRRSCPIHQGAQENRNRPSIDALFRSAAYHYRDSVIGIVLSGALDDGTSGLWNIKRMGGITMTQELSMRVRFDAVQRAVAGRYIICCLPRIWDNCCTS